MSGDAPEQEDWFSRGLGFLSGLVGSLFAFLNAEKEGATPSRPLRIVQQLGAAPSDQANDAPVYSLGAFPKPTEASDLRRADRHFTVVTTAALPWLTGPAVNAMLRAIAFARRKQSVLLVMPWIQREDQDRLFMTDDRFDSREEQEEYIRKWCKQRAGVDISQLPMQMQWYEARFVEQVRSIFPAGDVSAQLVDARRDVLILEEPEHLCWYHNGQRWPELYQHVVGIVHTNYRVYLAALGYEGFLGSPAVRDSIFYSFTSLVCSAYCDVTIKLSGAGVTLPNEVTCNVHGVRDEFFEIGGEAESHQRHADSAEPIVYFLGKAVFPKGWRQLLDLLGGASGALGGVGVEGYGSGPDLEAIGAEAAALCGDGGSAPLRVRPGLDHADEKIRGYRILVNPSTSDILCTVTAEAIAMRKRVVLPRHPSNQFFEEHFSDRCHFFEADDVETFAGALRSALGAELPPQLKEEQKAPLTWDSAVDRLCDAAEVRVLSGKHTRPSEVASARTAYKVHHGLQNDAPMLSEALKKATQKDAKPAPWQEYLAEFRETDAGRSLLRGGIK